jgi:hypothetical protein
MLAFLRDLALSLPAFHLRKQRAIVGSDFVPVPVLTLRRAALGEHRAILARDERDDPSGLLVWR